MTNKTKRREKYVTLVIPALAAAVMFGSAMRTTPVQAENSATLPVFNFCITDSNLITDLKTAVIKDRASKDENLDLDSINIGRSTIDVDRLDRSSTALQTVTVKVTLYTEDEKSSSSSVGYSFTEDAVVKLTQDSSPTIILRNNTVTVNNGDTWNPYSYFASVHDAHGRLPAIKETDNVDMSTDGTYTATYTAVALDGTTSTANLTVVVRTPQEVVDQLAAEAAQQAAEEAEQQAAEEEAQRLEEEERQKEEEEQAAQEALESAGSGNPVYGDGYNPYSGGWSNCTWSAWELANAYTGVSLPNFGNASGWAYAAAADGYATGSTPVAGSIAVYSNHVAYVSAVSADGSSVYIMEGGVNGGYYERWVSAWGTGTQSLQSYIYLGN